MGDDDGDWVCCTKCNRSFHDDCLISAVGKFHNCFECDFESELEMSSEEYDSEDIEIDIMNQNYHDICL